MIIGRYVSPQNGGFAMRKAVLAAALACFMTPAFSQDGRDAGVVSTIRKQMDAFLADDFTGAFEFASPSIRMIFRNPDNFGLMVRQGYPMVWRPSGVEFLDLREEGGQVIQRIVVEDQGGQFHVLDYYMVEGKNGWLINGVSIVPQPSASV